MQPTKERLESRNVQIETASKPHSMRSETAIEPRNVQTETATDQSRVVQNEAEIVKGNEGSHFIYERTGSVSPTYDDE